MIKEGISFHDSSVVAVWCLSNQMILHLEDVYVDGFLRKAVITITGFGSIICNGQPVSTFELPFNDAEVLKLESTPVSLSILLQSMNYKTRETITQALEFKAEHVTIEFL